ncbi:hypothetical protein VT84_31025 [Gemmata sp. SH-PL17]|uniref:hypothetical protein n=1 Tax=Gemmata sp. SH-PL17 TaxID=1630693 RepID=UPI00078CAE06|nr:hypothetical protein [Gemmata sp. SH-PL17]AMV28867.1 hypothetical protein VT84_31025 [Gemmata sp. SH-PL17]
MSHSTTGNSSGFDRRRFLGGAVAGTAALSCGSWISAVEPEVVAVDPRALEDAWKPLAEELAQALQLEAQAALAHRADEKKFALAGASEFQKAVFTWADNLKPELRKVAFDSAARASAELAPARKARFSRLPDIDPHGEVSVEAQYAKHLRTRAPLVSKAMLEDVFDGDLAKQVKALEAAGKMKAAPAPAAAGAVNKMALQLLNFKVPNTQDPIGKDEVRMSGIRLNTNGTAQKISAISLGDFKKGQKKTYSPPKTLTTFDLNLTHALPKSGGFCFIPFEHDVGGGYADVIDKALKKVKEWLAKELPAAAAKAGVALGTLISLPEFGAILGQILGKILGWLLGKLGDLIAKWLKDDVFPVPVWLKFHIKQPAIWANGATHGPAHSFWVSGNGGKWEWQVRWAAA